MSDNIKLSIEDMNLFYGNFHALKDINMHIPKKEITAFIGPSGCGKSTLLKSLNRMNDLAGRYTADYLSCGNLPYPAWKYAHDCAPKLQAYPPIFSLTLKASGST